MVVMVNLVLTVTSELGTTKCIGFHQRLTRQIWINFVKKREI